MSASQRRRLKVVREHDQVTRWGEVRGRFPGAHYRLREDGFFEGSLREGPDVLARADLRGLIDALLARESRDCPG